MSSTCSLHLQSFLTSSDCQEDIHFLIDASGSVRPSNFQKQKDFLKNFVSSLTIGPNDIQVGVTEFSNIPGDSFWMNMHADKNSLLAAIDAIPFPGGNTHTELALKFARQQAFTSNHGGRAGVPNVLILLTDGQSTVPIETAKEAELIHKENITVYAVGIGNNVDMNELQIIASSPEQLYSVSNFDALQNILADFEKNLGCPVGSIITAPAPQVATTTVPTVYSTGTCMFLFTVILHIA